MMDKIENLPWNLLTAGGQVYQQSSQVFFDALEDATNPVYTAWARKRLRIWNNKYRATHDPIAALAWHDEAKDLDKFVCDNARVHLHTVPHNVHACKCSTVHKLGLLFAAGSYLTGAACIHAVRSKIEARHHTIYGSYQQNQRFEHAAYECLLFGHKPPPVGR